jgi:uncharacterized membrane protein
MKNKIMSLSGISLLSLIGPVLADMGDGDFKGCWGSGMMGGWGYGGMIFGWLFGVLTLVALVLLIVWLIKQIESSGKKRK